MPPTPATSSHDLVERLGRPDGTRALVAAGLFIGGTAAAWLLATALGLGGFPRGSLVFAFPAVYLIGYQLWYAKVVSAGMRTMGRRLGGALWHLLVRREPVTDRTDLLPTADEVERFAELTLAATSVFRTLAIGAAVGVAAIIAMLNGSWLAAAVAAIALMGWGRLLSSLGRNGWLLLPGGE